MNKADNLDNAQYGAELSSESSQLSYLSGHQTLPLTRKISSEDGPQHSHSEHGQMSSETSNRDGQSLVGPESSISSSLLDGLDAEDVRKATTPFNETSYKLREKLTFLKKREQELVGKQWKANKVEMVSCIPMVSSPSYCFTPCYDF
jgi:hypothetical protein